MKFRRKILRPLAVITITVLVAAAIAVVSSGRKNAQQNSITIGILNYTPAAESSVIGFRKGMLDLGYFGRDNFKILYSGVIDDADRLAEEAQRLVEYPVDLLVTMSSPATLIAKEAVEGTDIPIVFGPVSNPIENGIVKSFQHPGESITGVMFGLQEDKRLELLTVIDPGVRRLYVPYNPENRSTMNALRKMEKTAVKLGLELVLDQFQKPEDLDEMLATMPKDIDAVYIATDPILVEHSAKIAAAATERGLISSTPHRDGVRDGALYSYSFDLLELGKEVARLSDQVLNGVSPEDLPVEVSEFFLSVNLTTADALGISIPEPLLRQAVIYR